MAARFLLVMVLVPLLAGCVEPSRPPDALMVRAFVDDVDGDGHDETVVRLAGWWLPDTVAPFDGTVEVRMESLEGVWIPRYHIGSVERADFQHGELPYYEVRFPSDFLRPGERLVIRATADLAGGVVVRGDYEASA